MLTVVKFMLNPQMFLFKKTCWLGFWLGWWWNFTPQKRWLRFFQEQLWNAVLVNGGDEEVLACGVGWTWASGLVWWLVRGDLLGLFNHLLGLFTNLLVTIPTKMGEQKPICWILCSLFLLIDFFEFLIEWACVLVSWVSVFFVCGWPVKPFYSFITLARVLALMFEKIRLPHWMVLLGRAGSAWCLCILACNLRFYALLLLMAEILYQLRLVVYPIIWLQGFLLPRCCRISSIKSISW